MVAAKLEVCYAVSADLNSLELKTIVVVGDDTKVFKVERVLVVIYILLHVYHTLFCKSLMHHNASQLFFHIA